MYNITRRDFLKGLVIGGAALALPFPILEAEASSTKLVSATSGRMARLPSSIYSIPRVISSPIGDVILVEGAMGSGKSLWGVALAHNAKEVLGLDVYSNLRLNESFGNYELLTPEALGNAQDSIFLIDEASLYFNATLPSFNSWSPLAYQAIDSARHRNSIFILTTPKESLLDRRVRELIDYKVTTFRGFSAGEEASFHAKVRSLVVEGCPRNLQLKEPRKYIEMYKVKEEKL